MKLKIKSLTLFFLTVGLTYCQSKPESTKFDSTEIEFSYASFVDELGEQVELDSFIIEKAEIALTSSLKRIDVGSLYEDADGNKYLGSVGEYILDYSNSPDSLLTLGFYLKDEYNLKNSIYDQFLRQCIYLDQDYSRAYFLLAELRFKKGGYVEDSYFLISKLRHLVGANKEVNRIYNYFKNRTDHEPLSPDNFNKYLDQDYFYIVE